MSTVHIVCPFCQRVYLPKQVEKRHGGGGDTIAVTVWKDEDGHTCDHFLTQRYRCQVTWRPHPTIPGAEIGHREREGHFIIFSSRSESDEKLLAVTEDGRQFVWERD